MAEAASYASTIFQVDFLALSNRNGPYNTQSSDLWSELSPDVAGAGGGRFFEGMLPDGDDFSSAAPELASDPAVRKFVPIIQNDRQVFHVVISKSYPPGQSHGLGHVSVSRMH